MVQLDLRADCTLLSLVVRRQQYAKELSICRKRAIWDLKYFHIGSGTAITDRRSVSHQIQTAACRIRTVPCSFVLDPVHCERIFRRIVVELRTVITFGISYLLDKGDKGRYHRYNINMHMHIIIIIIKFFNKKLSNATSHNGEENGVHIT